jgi:hypothetical protein
VQHEALGRFHLEGGFPRCETTGEGETVATFARGEECAPCAGGEGFALAACFAGADGAGELVETVAVFDFGFVVFETVVELGEVDRETMLTL